MLSNGRAATSALAIAGVMPGILVRSASETVLASTTPSDLPTCAAAGIASNTARVNATKRVMLMSSQACESRAGCLNV